MSVDFPAPFSPRSACTSPRRRVKSMPSLATTGPHRFVIPRSSRASGAGSAEAERSACSGCGPSSVMVRSRRPWPAAALGLAAHRVGDTGDRPVGDLLLDLLDLRGVLLPRRGHLAQPDAVVLDLEHRIAAALEGAALGALDGLEHGDVDLLQRACEDLRAEVGLVGVDADRL